MRIGFCDNRTLITQKCFKMWSGTILDVPDQSRTDDLPLRRRLLYPAELQRQKTSYFIVNGDNKEVNLILIEALEIMVEYN